MSKPNTDRAEMMRARIARAVAIDNERKEIEEAGQKSTSLTNNQILDLEDAGYTVDLVTGETTTTPAETTTPRQRARQIIAELNEQGIPLTMGGTLKPAAPAPIEPAPEKSTGPATIEPAPEKSTGPATIEPTPTNFERITGLILSTQTRKDLERLRQDGYKIAKAGPADAPRYTLRGPGVEEFWTDDPVDPIKRAKESYRVEEIDPFDPPATLSKLDRETLEEIARSNFVVEHVDALGYRLRRRNFKWLEHYGASADLLRGVIDQYRILDEIGVVIQADLASTYYVLHRNHWSIETRVQYGGHEEHKAINERLGKAVITDSLGETLARALAYHAEERERWVTENLIDDMDKAVKTHCFSARYSDGGSIRYTLRRKTQEETSPDEETGPWHSIHLRPLVDLALGKDRTIGQKIKETHEQQRRQAEEPAKIAKAEPPSRQAAAIDYLNASGWTIVFLSAPREEPILFYREQAAEYAATASEAAAYAYYSDQHKKNADVDRLTPAQAEALVWLESVGYIITPPIICQFEEDSFWWHIERAGRPDIEFASEDPSELIDWAKEKSPHMRSVVDQAIGVKRTSEENE